MSRPVNDGAVAPTELSVEGATLPAVELPIVDPRRYHRVDVIGQGGLGRVTQAEDARFKRKVAIKEPHPNLPGATSILLQEALLTARLQHPGVAPVYDAGYWPDGSPFYAMKLIEGQTLAEVIESASTPSQRLPLLTHVIAVADTVAYAHSRGIIHRDIKPANIVVGAFGETVVLDWGIADQKSGDSPSGVAGTVGYMAPEQQRGEKVDARADVFALGATLYHVLAGGPLGSMSPPSVAPDLQAILDKALAESPERRYSDAAAMASDLRRFTAGQLVSAYRYNLIALIARWLRRHKAAVSVAVVFLAALTLLIVYTIKEQAAARDRDAERTRVLTLLQARSSMTADGAHGIAWLKTLRTDDLGAARVLAAAANSRGVARVIWPMHSNVIHSMVVSPDGRFIATASRDRTAKLLDIVRGTTIELFGHTSEIHQAAFDADGKHVVTASADGTARIWTLDGHEVWKVEIWAIAGGQRTDLQDDISTVVLLDGARTLITGDRQGRLAITKEGGTPVILARLGSDIETLQLGGDGHSVFARTADNQATLVQLDGTATMKLPRAVAGVGVALLGDRLATASDRTITLWSSTGVELEQTTIEATISRLVSDGSRLLVGDVSGGIHQWVPGQPARRLAAGGTTILDLVAVGTDRVFAGGADGHVFDCDLQRGVMTVLRGHDGLANHVAVAQGALVSAGADGTVRLWTNAPPATLRSAGSAALDTFAIAPDGTVALARVDGTIELVPGGRVTNMGASILDLAVSSAARRIAYSVDRELGVVDWSGRRIGTVRDDEGRAGFIAWAPDGSRLAVSSSTNRIKVLDSALRVVRELRTPGNVEARVVFVSPRKLVSAGWDGLIRLWDLDSNAEPIVLGRHRGPALGVAVSHSGDFVSSVGVDGLVLLHDLRNARIRVLGFHSGVVSRAAFSPDDRFIVTSGRDLALGVWPVDGTQGRLLPGHSDAVSTLNLSPDGQLATTAALDGTVRLWDLQSGESQTLENVGKDPIAAWFAAGNSRIATAGGDGTIRELSVDIPGTPEAFHAWLDALTTLVVE